MISAIRAGNEDDLSTLKDLPRSIRHGTCDASAIDTDQDLQWRRRFPTHIHRSVLDAVAARTFVIDVEVVRESGNSNGITAALYVVHRKLGHSFKAARLE